MAAGGGKGGAKSDINVTPLVDVCLVLLIIFMVLVPRNVPEISVRIPPESKVNRPPPEGDRPLVVTMDKDGGLTLNQRGYEKEELAKEIERQMESRAKKVVFVDFDHKAKYGEAVEVIDLVKKNGAEVVGIMRARDYVMPEDLNDY
jgi:biopolymer transport protein ExbD